MATTVDIESFQGALNAWNRHHVPDLLGPIRVDGVWGPMTKKVGLRSAYYFDIGMPTIRSWTNHFTDEGIAHMTRWWRHPREFYIHHPGALYGSAKRIRDERNKRKAHPKGGLLLLDGRIWVAAWIHPVLLEARRHGWHGTIPDSLGGFRTFDQQARLYYDYTHGGGIAASPYLPSNHQLKTWDGGAADCSYYDQLQDILDNVMNTDLGRFGASYDPVHFSSRHRFQRTGHI